MAARKKVIPEVRYRLVSDDSGHDYTVPEDKADEFYEWAYEYDNSEAPAYATRIDGRFTFTDPRCE